ncbi:unnamed protein product [Hymenolepis diminuta]|uniref:Uncharacterized protein n=1 Tax=Hymenolepis diminuta TaxID=6216 RepID=A0A564Y7K3_HYMDI|nr:unnamed protein product [Hymenolepis diminuta]
MTASFHIKSTSALMFSSGLIKVTRIKLGFPHRNNARLPVTGSYASCSSPLFLSTPPYLPLSLSLESILIVVTLTTSLV